MLWGVATGALEADQVAMWLPRPVGILLLEQGTALQGAAVMRRPSTLERAGVTQLLFLPDLVDMQLLSTLGVVTVSRLQAGLATLHL